MRFTSPDELPIPDGTDTAAAALYLQRFAERVDEILTEQWTALAAAQAPPAFVMTNSSSADYEYTFNGILDKGGFININTDIYRSNNGPAASRTFHRTGLWLVGWTMHTQAVGAVNAGTYRRGHLLVDVNDSLSGAEIEGAYDISYTTTEKSNGATSLSAQQMVYIPPDAVVSGTTYGSFGLWLSHGNSSSFMQVAAGNAKVWGLWISDDDLIRGV